MSAAASKSTNNGSKYSHQKSKEEAEVDEIIEQLDNPSPAAVPAGLAQEGASMNLEERHSQQKSGKRHLIAKGPGASTIQYHNAKKDAAITKNSRKSRNGLGRGLAKKGGAGGKGVWGKIGDELADYEEDMRNEPEDEPDEFDVAQAQKDEITKPDQLRAALLPILNEYYNHANAAEVIRYLEGVSIKPTLVHLIAQVAITASLDKTASERELTSVLLAEFYDTLLLEEQFEAAFDQLLTELPDLVLDYPDIVGTLANYIARCIADDCLAPKYVYSRQEKEQQLELAVAVLAKAAVMINMNHGLVRLDNVWGVSGGIRPVKHLIKKMHYILKEYVDSSGDVMEALRCLEELHVPHFYHEFVYEAVLLVMEDGSERAFELLLKLLKEGATELVLTVDQLETGFQRVYDDLGDIVLDVPSAYALTEKFANKCQEQGIISQDALKKFPARGRKRYASENDGGRIKEDSAEFRQRVTSNPIPVAEEEDEE